VAGSFEQEEHALVGCKHPDPHETLLVPGRGVGDPHLEKIAPGLSLDGQRLARELLELCRHSGRSDALWSAAQDKEDHEALPCRANQGSSPDLTWLVNSKVASVSDHEMKVVEHADELQPFPAQMGRSFGDGVLHLGADVNDPGIDPAKECYPCGQGAGAIDELVSAAELVARFMEEAEEALSKVDQLRGASVR